MSSKRYSVQENRPRREDQRTRLSDPRHDIQCQDKDLQISKYKDRCIRFAQQMKEKDKLLLDTMKDNSRLKTESDEKSLQIEVLNKKCSGINTYINTMDSEQKSLQNKLLAEQKRSEELRKQLDDKSKSMEALKSRNEEDDKRQKVVIRKYKEDIQNLNKKLEMKASHQYEDIDELKAAAERLTNELEIKNQSFKKCQQRYQSMKAHNQSLQTQLKKFELDNHSLKKQRKYFQDQNEKNKRKFVGTSTTAIKQKQMCHNYIRKMAKNSLESNKSFFTDLIQMIEAKQRESHSKQLKDIADIVLEMREEDKHIETAEKRILEKRADERVQCSECDNTFASTGDLTHHLTVTHRMNVTDRSKNLITVITLED